MAFIPLRSLWPTGSLKLRQPRLAKPPRSVNPTAIPKVKPIKLGNLSALRLARPIARI